MGMKSRATLGDMAWIPTNRSRALCPHVAGEETEAQGGQVMPKTPQLNKE